MDFKNNILEAVGNTPLIKLNRMFADFDGVTVLAKLETQNPGGSMKDRIGIKMIERAEAEGRIKPGDTLVEPTSGNTGIGIAQAAAVKGYKMIITMPEKMSDEKRRLITAYGAQLILAPTELAHDHPDNYIEVAKRIARENENTHLLNQYTNTGNPDAHYDGTGPEIWTQTNGKLDYIVSGMGTGGTISGTTKYLKEKNAAIVSVGADPDGSLYTGDVKPYQVEGIGYDFYPAVFNHKIVDKMFRITDKESFTEVRNLAKMEGILGGGSTGTTLSATRKLLEELRGENALAGKVVVMFIHDNGRSYLSKIYNDDWMREHGFFD